MQITIDVEKIDGLFLKQEMGTGQIGDEEMAFGISLPDGAPYVHVRGEYYGAAGIFEKMLRAAHEQTGCETRDEAKASDLGAAYGSLHGQHAGRTPACPAGADICAGRICTHGPDDQRPDES